jgi:TonB family protein
MTRFTCADLAWWPRFISAMLLTAVMMAGADDPQILFEKARVAHAGHDYAKAIRLLRKADTLWETSAPDVAPHAAALNEMVLLMFADTYRDARGEAQTLKIWKAEAQPATARAVAICERSCEPDSADLALALELNADAMGRTAAGAPFWDRATGIRAHRVSLVRAAAAATTHPVQETGTVEDDKLKPGVSAPTLIAKHEPMYTETARLMHIQGSALLSVIIDAQGTPGHFRLKNGLGYGLDEEAATTVSTWRFRPATKDGVAVAVRADILVNFRLL